MNLISNAVQAMDETGGTRHGRDRRSTTGSSSLRFADTGPGIPRETLGKVFDPFFSTRDDGTGLGLTIVHRIVDEHDGHIEVDERAGRGNGVHRLAAGADDETADGGGHARRVASEKRVLIADDEKNMRWVLGQALDGRGLRGRRGGRRQGGARRASRSRRRTSWCSTTRCPRPDGMEVLRAHPREGAHVPGHHAHRARQRRDGGRGDEGGRDRVPHEAVRPRGAQARASSRRCR